MGRPAKWTPEMDRRAVEMAAEGHTTREIGAVLGVTRNAVISRINRKKIAPEKWPEHDRILELIGQDFYSNEIAERIGRSKSGVGAYLRRHHIRVTDAAAKRAQAVASNTWKKSQPKQTTVSGGVRPMANEAAHYLRMTKLRPAVFPAEKAKGHWYVSTLGTVPEADMIAYAMRKGWSPFRVAA